MSKAEVLIWVQNLHHDEAGISELCDLLLRADDTRTCTNVAWIFSHLSLEDKTLYLSSRYEELVRLALSPEVPVRLGLVMPTPSRSTQTSSSAPSRAARPAGILSA